MELVEQHVCFGGKQSVYQHDSQSLNCRVNFAIYTPAEAENEKLPVLYWLSGLTCNEQNFITKAGAQQFAAENKVILVAPDTSPRGDNIADDEAYDLGKGAGFYVNATQSPWAEHYRMYDYIVDELPALIDANFPNNGKRGIFGHSMGGHGALVIALRNPDKFLSVSAFAPIVAPSQVAWGEKAFSAYLGNDRSTWLEYDAVELVKRARIKRPILVEQGLDDNFLQDQLKPELLEQACIEHKHPLSLNLRAGYDHSYYFIASFIEQHIAYHAKQLS